MSILIERTTESGYQEKEYEIDEAIKVLNQELENERVIWLDGKPHLGSIIIPEDIISCKRSICVTNKLIGG